MKWFYQKIPENEIENISEYLDNRDLKSLKKIHDQYKLSTFTYGCCNLEGLIYHFEHGIKKRNN